MGTFFDIKVSVVCLCYNHEKFVEQCLKSVFEQSHKNIELIIIDDESSDNSQQVIKSICQLATKLDTTITIQTIFHEENQGNCKSFNEALKFATGKYIIDLAADDVMLPKRITEQISQLEASPKNVALCFSDSIYIDVKNKIIGKSISSKMFDMPSGDVFEKLLAFSFICPTTLMFKRDILVQIGGYDENLSFEDLDIWFRLARNYHFAYINKTLMYKRVLSNSLSASRYKTKNTWLTSCLKVMQKIKLVLHHSEEKAFAQRINHYIAESFWAEHFDLTPQFEQLIQTKYLNIKSKIYCHLSKWRIPNFGIYFKLLFLINTFKKYFFTTQD